MIECKIDDMYNNDNKVNNYKIHDYYNRYMHYCSFGNDKIEDQVIPIYESNASKNVDMKNYQLGIGQWNHVCVEGGNDNGKNTYKLYFINNETRLKSSDNKEICIDLDCERFYYYFAFTCTQCNCEDVKKGIEIEIRI